MDSEVADVEQESTNEVQPADNVPIETPAMIADESEGTTTPSSEAEATSATAATKTELSSVGEPWTLAGDSDHNRTSAETEVATEMAQYFIPVEPVKQPVPPNREVLPTRLSGSDDKPASATTSSSRRESQSNVLSGDESVGSKEEATVASEVYVRPDGKKVRKIKRRSLDTNSVDESMSVGSASVGEIYIRPDGKKVRRVKKRKPKSVATEGGTDLSQQPMAPLEEDEEFVKESTVEPSDGNPPPVVTQEVLPQSDRATTVEPSPVMTQGALPHSDSLCPFEKDFQDTIAEPYQQALVDITPSAASAAGLENPPAKDEMLLPISEVNPWTMDPILDEEASQRSRASHRSMASHRSLASRPSIEAKNPFDTPIPSAKLSPPNVVNPFDTLLQDPPVVVVQPPPPPPPRQPPASPAREPISPTAAMVASLSNMSGQNFSFSPRRDPQSTFDSNSPKKVPTNIRPQPITVSDTAVPDQYVRFDDHADNMANSSQRDVSSPVSTNSNRNSGTRQPFAESIMARTRSRADPTASIASPPRNPRASLSIRVSVDDDAFILNTALARKRIRVVQLLIAGLFGFLFGFLGNVFIQSSCHFATAKVAVGTNGQVFRLHYGLWKFTPLDSVFQGYTYCYNYHDRFSGEAPFIPRAAGLLAMLMGGYSLCIVWYYLIFGEASEFYWRWCIRTATTAGIMQFMTMFFFVDDVCRSNPCALGPAGIVSLASATMWLILGFELWYNMPVSAWAPDIGDLVTSPEASLMGNLEMSDFEDGTKAYFRRMRPNHDLPTLNQIQRENENPIGEGMREISVSPRGTYIPPLVVDL